MSVAVDALTLADARRIERAQRRGLFKLGYGIQAGEGGPVKVGVTENLAARIKTLQTANHKTLIVLAAWRVAFFEEKDIHDEFAHARIRGEWFHPVPELLEFLERAGGEFLFDDWDLR